MSDAELGSTVKSVVSLMEIMTSALRYNSIASGIVFIMRSL